MKRIIKLVALAMLICPTVSVGQTPLAYHKKISGGYNSIVSSGLFPDNQGVLMVGQTKGSQQPTYVKVDENMDTLWSKTFSVGSSLSLSSIVPIHNNDYYHLGIDGDSIILSRSHNLSYQWSKAYTLDTALQNILFTLNFATRLNDNNVAIVGRNDFPTYGGFATDAAPMVALTDSNGVLLWSKQYSILGGNFWPTHIVSRSMDYMVIGTFFISTPSSQSTNKIASLRIEKTTGSPIGNINIIDSNDGEFTLGGVSNDGNYIVGNDFGVFNNPATSLGFVSKINPDGSFQWVKTIEGATHHKSQFNTIHNDLTGNLFIGGKAWTTDSIGNDYVPQFCAIKMDTTLSTIYWSKIYSDTASDGSDLQAGEAILCRMASDNNPVFYGSYTGADGLNYAIKVKNTDGTSGCNERTESVTINTLPYTSNVYTANVYLPTALAATQPYTLANDVPLSADAAMLPTVITECSTYTGISKAASEENFSVYPQPATSQIFINWTDNYSASYRLINSVGKKLNEGKLVKGINNIDIQNLSSGIYILHIYNNGTNHSKKIIIN